MEGFPADIDRGTIALDHTEESTIWLDDVSTEADGVNVRAVILTANDDGTLANEFVWMLELPAVPPLRTTPTRVMVPATIDRTGWKDVIHTLAAVIEWGDWSTEPVAAAKVTNKAKRARLAKQGVVPPPPIQILTTARPQTVSSTGDGTHASPITHLRRGHWRRTPVGPRGDSRHELRWIAPVVVNPDRQKGDTRERIWRLPQPKD